MSLRVGQNPHRDVLDSENKWTKTVEIIYEELTFGTEHEGMHCTHSTTLGTVTHTGALKAIPYFRCYVPESLLTF